MPAATFHEECAPRALEQINFKILQTVPSRDELSCYST